MGHLRSSSLLWPGLGLVAAVALHAVAGWGVAPGFAQGVPNSTHTESTTSTTSFESPPDCSVIGSSRQVQTITTALTVGPGCIGIGNRDLANPAPDCQGLPPAAAPVDPGFGTVALVPFGSSNLNVNVHTETIQCIAAVPVLPWPALLGLGGALGGLGLWSFRHRRVS